MRSAHQPVVFVFLVVLAMVAVVGISRLSAGRDLIPWRSDFAAAQAEAQKSDKPIFAYFTAEWCAPCQDLKRTTWSDKKVESALQAYIPLKLDVDANTTLAQRYNIEPIPAFLILDSQGNVTANHAGALGADDFLAWLRSSR